MKPQVDFYLLNYKTFGDALIFICQLVEKSYQQNYAPVIKMESLSDAEALDHFLWTFRNTSFIPHFQKNSTPEILTTAIHSDPTPLLVNCFLSQETVLLEYGRLLQIVPNQDLYRELARNHYRFYKQQGYHLNTHNLALPSLKKGD